MTVLPAATIGFAPIVTSLSIVTCEPSQTLSPIVIPTLRIGWFA